MVITLHCRFGSNLVHWKQALRAHVPQARFGKLEAETRDSRHHFSVQVFLHQLDPQSVKVELYANPNGGHAAVRHMMKPLGALNDDEAACTYTCSVPAERPLSDYTPRLVFFHPDATVPLEAAESLWQH